MSSHLRRHRLKLLASRLLELRSCVRKEVDSSAARSDSCRVSILDRLSGVHRNGRRRSYWPFISFALFCIVFFGYRAAVENDTASRQKTSFGIIGQCEERGRGHDNYCDYIFSVGDKQYTAVSKAERGLNYGQTVTVYYDAQNPRSSSLEDFSKQRRHDLRFIFIVGLLLITVVAFALWDRAPYGKTSYNHVP
jgi:hypothetical protein